MVHTLVVDATAGGARVAMTLQLEAPRRMKRTDGLSRFAYVTFLIRNDSYLPGALVLAHALRIQGTRADLVCLVTPEISLGARGALGLLYDHVVEVEQLYVAHRRRQERQDRPYLFTRIQGLRLGADGDIGLWYEKVAVVDADLLPLRYYDCLFGLSTPAGVINERKEHVMEVDERGRYVIADSVDVDGTWKWHRIYGDVCPHGARIPAEITDRVSMDPTNMGVNSALYVLEPSLREYDEIMRDLERPEVRELVGGRFDWPEMQYLTWRWSGQWTNIDIRFSGFNGYPRLSVLYGTHYAGFKPWSFKKAKAMARWARYDDFRVWFRRYIEMYEAYPDLSRFRRLARLCDSIRQVQAAGDAQARQAAS